MSQVTGTNGKRPTALMAIVVWLLICILIVAVVPFPSDYLATARKKHHRLDAIGSPKILLVGGSNLAFGVDSTKLEQALRLPVANMGLRGALGLDYMFNEVKPRIGKGDVIVFSPESKSFYEAVSDDGAVLVESLLVYPDGAKYVDFRDFFRPGVNLLHCFFRVCNDKMVIYGWEIKTWLASKCTVWPEAKAYCCRAFDGNGDHIAHLLMPSVPIEPADYDDGSLDDFTLSLVKIHEFAEFARAQGAHVVYAPPPFPSGALYFERHRRLCDKIYRAMKAQKDIDVISPEERFVMAPNCFFDTVNHLNANGRVIRTDRLIADLGSWMAGQRRAMGSTGSN